MNYFNGFRETLLHDAKFARREMDAAAENFSGSEEEASQFFELVAQQKKSEYAFNEHTRVRHMLLKSGLDGGQ